MNFQFNMTARVNIDKYGTILEKRGLDEGGRAQQALDNQILKDCDPYVPMLTGMMKDSGPIHTAIGSGIIIYWTPYARKQYYTNGGDGLRGKLWFERAKADHLSDWCGVVAEVSGGTVSLL